MYEKPTITRLGAFETVTLHKWIRCDPPRHRGHGGKRRGGGHGGWCWDFDLPDDDPGFGGGS